jgi:hypothetical protein
MRRVESLVVVRSLVVANAILLAVVGALFFFFGASPAGVLVAAGLWSGAGLLLGCLPLTDPRRGEQPSRW